MGGWSTTYIFVYVIIYAHYVYTRKYMYTHTFLDNLILNLWTNFKVKIIQALKYFSLRHTMYQRQTHQQSDEKCIGRNEETFTDIALMKELNTRGKTEKSIQISFLSNEPLVFMNA